MAGEWIKIENVTPDKPEIFQMAEILNIDPDSVLGKLIRVWVWADEQTYDGNAEVPCSLIDRIASLVGFGDAMRSVSWLDKKGFPNFARHNSQAAKQRASVAKRVAKHRSQCNANVTPSRYKSVTIPRPMRRQVFERDDSACVYCGRKSGEYSPPRETKDDATLSVDHVIPLAQGGATELLNLVAACGCCNRTKGDRTPSECGFEWPTDVTGKRYGSVTSALPRVEKSRVEKETTNVVSSSVQPPTPPSGLDASLKKENPTGFRFPMVGGKLWDLPPRKLEEYRATYSNRLDCEFELRKARQWLTDNSSRRPRTARGIASFLTRWLNRANDSAQKTMPGSKVAVVTKGMVLNAETGEFVMPKGASSE